MRRTNQGLAQVPNPSGSTDLVNLWVGPIDPRDSGASGVLTANAAVLDAFQVLAPITVNTCSFLPMVQSGNVDIGIYSAAGVRLASTGSFLVPVAVTFSSKPLSGPVDLVPSVIYYSALAVDNAVATFAGVTTTFTPNASQLIPPVQVAVAASFPLPANIVIGNASSARGVAVFYSFV